MLSDVVTSIGHQHLCLHPTTRIIFVSTRISTTVVPFLAIPALGPRQGNMSQGMPTDPQHTWHVVYVQSIQQRGNRNLTHQTLQLILLFGAVLPQELLATLTLYLHLLSTIDESARCTAHACLTKSLLPSLNVSQTPL
jgi:hypothetical protein